MNSEFEKFDYAYIFDFDGVLVDSMELVYQCYREIVKEEKMNIDYDEFCTFGGMTVNDIISSLCKQKNCFLDSKYVAEQINNLYLSRITQIKPININVLLAKMLKKNGFGVAIASGSPKHIIKTVAINLSLQVDAIVSSDEVEFGKPRPDVFLRAAELLGVPPKNCIVIEDSKNGIEGAKAAGMRVYNFI